MYFCETVLIFLNIKITVYFKEIVILGFLFVGKKIKRQSWLKLEMKTNVIRPLSDSYFKRYILKVISVVHSRHS